VLTRLVSFQLAFSWVRFGVLQHFGGPLCFPVELPPVAYYLWSIIWCVFGVAVAVTIITPL
jgi:hypothetical protein